MTTGTGDFYLDACTILNFAAVDRLHLLQSFCGAGAKWTEVVQDEATADWVDMVWRLRISAAAWLGDPIENFFSPLEHDEVRSIQLALGADPHKPFEHLGEAEMVYMLTSSAPGATLVTDDRSAADYATKQGISVKNSVDVMTSSYKADLIGCPDAFELLRSMKLDHNRGVIVPSHHSRVC